MTPQDIIDNWCSEWKVLDSGRLLADINQAITEAITEAVEEERRACIGVIRNFSPTENQRKAFVIGGVRGVFGSMQNAFADAIEARGKKL